MKLIVKLLGFCWLISTCRWLGFAIR